MSTSKTTSRRFRPLHWFLIFCAAGTLVLAVKVAGVFFLTREARTLQAAVVEASAWRVDPQIQLSVGPGMLAVGRVAAAWMGDVPKEVRQALGTIERASVGIYQLHDSRLVANRAALLAATDRKMAGRGWSRVVAVVDGGDTVLVYAPDDAEDLNRVRLCVAVYNGRELVVVSAQARTASLAEWVRPHLPNRRAI